MKQHRLNYQQDRQRTYNVTLTRIHATIVAVESNKDYIFWVCDRGLGYPACNVNVPYFHLWPAQIYNIFIHYLKRHNFFLVGGGGALNTKCVFWFSLQLLPETSHILRRNEGDMIKNVNWSSCKVPILLSDFHDTWIFSTHFQKIFKYQISWKSI
jgi:hypothetical protein